MVVHRKILAMVSLTVFIFSAVSAAEIKNADNAINVAGKQRMLAYRILRDYMMVSMESNYKDPKKDMAASISQFEKADERLNSILSDSATKKKFEKLKKAFIVFKKSVSQPFDKTSAGAVVDKTAEVRIAAHELTLHLTKLSASKTGQIVNIAGRLRALSQKLASMYILETLIPGSESAKDKMSQGMKTFRENLDLLSVADDKDSKIKTKLKKLEKIYLFFQVMNNSEDRVPTMVVKKSDKMLKYANEIVEIYLNKGDK